METPATSTQFVETPISHIDCEGAYISKETGRLFLIPVSALIEGRTPCFNVVGPRGEEMVIRLSTNPYAPVEKLRVLASQANVDPSF